MSANGDVPSKKGAQAANIAGAIAKMVAKMVAEEFSSLLDAKLAPILDRIAEMERVIVEATSNAIARSDVSAAEVRMQLDVLGGNGTMGAAHAAKAAGAIAKPKTGGKKTKAASTGKKMPSNARLYAAEACLESWNSNYKSFIKKYSPGGDADAYIAQIRADNADNKAMNKDDWEPWLMKRVGLALWGIKANQAAIRTEYKAYQASVEDANASKPLVADTAAAGGGGGAAAPAAAEPAKPAVDEGEDFLADAGGDDDGYGALDEDFE